MLSSISIRGFKAITKELKLNNLAPINYLIGPNGSGKSSVLEGIRFLLPSNKSPLFNSDYDAVAFDNIIPKLFGYKNFKDFDINMKDIFKNDFRFNFSIDNIQFEFTLPDKWYEYGIHVMEVNNKPVLTKDFGLKHIELISINILNQDVYSYLSNSISIESNMIDFQHMIEKGVKLNQAPTVIGLREIFGINFATIGLKSERKLIIQERFGSDYDIVDYDIIDINKVASGYKVLFILLDLLNRKDSKAKDVCVLIEEPEIGLHPKFQKLFPILIQNFINEHSKYTSLQFFISTHSPFIINSALELDRERYESLSDEDKKSFKPTHKVYHLDKVDGITKLVGEIPTTSSATQERNFVSTYDSILGSIGVQPSDLLFANGVIWVEGPSDAIYIEHWLKLYQEKLKKENPELKVLKKGSAYSFQMLNLICLNHTGANEKFWNDPESIQEAINLLEINRKFVVVIDNDGDFENCLPNANSESPSQRERKIKFLDKIKEQKKIISEGYEGIRNNEMDFWIGKEAMTIENYLKNLIAIKGEESVAQYDSKNGKEIIIKNIFNFSKAKPEYTKAKAYYARQICKKFTNLDDFCSEGDELYTNIQSLYATIQSWNEPK
jgi:predicted ATPase